jgi:hypothetical protein
MLWLSQLSILTSVPMQDKSLLSKPISFFSAPASTRQSRLNFEEHQRTTNAALQSLEAILLQLIRNNS